MGLTFTTAPTVAEGEAITSTQMAALCDAFIDRMRSGLGDPTWRIHWYCANLCRQFRNPDSTGLSFPPVLEWQQQWMHYAPGTQPDMPGAPGDYEGPNLAAVMNAFVHGNPSVESESDRLAVVDLDPNENTLEDFWKLGKVQRGGYDPANPDEQWTPALAAAQDHYRIVQPQGSFHGKSYGGYIPLPTRLGDCGDDEETPNYQYSFTSLVEGVPDKTYAGSCPSWTPNYATNHVQAIWSGPLAYYVFLGDGTVDYLPKSEWLEGPYSGGGYLKHPDGQQIERLMLNPFSKEYRGTDGQRIGEYDITQFAFPFETFFTSQYFLAPAKASWDGDELDVTYPVLTFATQLAGSESTSHSLTAGFVLGGVFVKAVGLLEETSVQILADTTVLTTLTLDPDDDGNASALEYFTEGPTPTAVKAKLVSAATGSVTVEVAEILEYRPQFNDAYLVLRTATALPLMQEVDRRGIDEAQAQKVWENLSTYGCIVPLNGAVAVNDNLESITTNPVYDAARRFIRKHTRVVERRQFYAYELNSEGKSVLYFRTQFWNDDDADSFEGITGAIRHTALPRGRTNEWLMFMQTRVYNPNLTEDLNTSSYTDIFGFNNRCHFMNPRITPTSKPDLLRHFTQGPPYPDYLLAPEAPPGYNMADNSNVMTSISDPDDVRREYWYRSCQIYPPDYEIESAEALNEGGQQCVKITFTGRLRHCDEAPSSIGRDVSTWDVDALKAEPYRTDENALREYLVDQWNSSLASVKNGDTAVPSGSIPAGPLNAAALVHTIYGSCYPTFFFTQLPRKPYEDTNDTQDSDDTICDVDDFLQMEMYLRAMCEGYVDGETSIAYACENAVESIFDYTFENLCYEALENRWFTTLPESVRDDNAQGFGPMPNTIMYADIFNQFSACVNLLTKARVMLPHKLEVFQRDYEDSAAIAYDIGTDDKFIRTNQAPPAATTPVDPETWQWESADIDGGTGLPYIVSTSVSSYLGDFSGGVPILTTTRQNMSWRFSLQDPTAAYALPEAWRSDYETLGGGFIAHYERDVVIAYATAGAGPTECSDQPAFWTIDSTDYEVGQNTTETDDCRAYGSGGTLDVGTPNTATFWRGTTGLGTCTGVSSISDLIMPVSTATGIYEATLV